MAERRRTDGMLQEAAVSLRRQPQSRGRLCNVEAYTPVVPNRVEASLASSIRAYLGGHARERLPDIAAGLAWLLGGLLEGCDGWTHARTGLGRLPFQTSRRRLEYPDEWLFTASR